MWTLKIISGVQRGQTFLLRDGQMTLGRSKTCDFVLESAGISKEHAVLNFQGTRLFIQDLKSRHGVVVNGRKVQSIELKPGDRFAIYDVLIEVVRPAHELQVRSNNSVVNFPPGIPGSIPSSLPGSIQGSTPPTWDVQQGQAQKQSAAPQNFAESLQQYIEDVALPGIYRLGQIMEVKWVIAFFIFGFALVLTTLSVFPLVQITQSTIERESQRRAMSLANYLAERYQRSVRDGAANNFSTESAEKEEGVKVALIVSGQDGHILAPLSKAGSYANEPFLHKARKSDKRMVEMIDSSLIGASVPIVQYSADQEGYSPIAYAVVLYNIHSFEMNDGRFISLFMQVLLFAMVLSLIVYYFLYRFIQHPISVLNQQVSRALSKRDGQADVEILFPELQELIVNVNTALSRAQQAQPATQSASPFSQEQEWEDLLSILPTASVIISSEGRIVACNAIFEDLIGMRRDVYLGQDISALPDQSLQLNLQEFLQQSQSSQIFSDAILEFSGRRHVLQVKTLTGSKNDRYIFVSLQLQEVAA